MGETVLLHSSRTDILLAGPEHNSILKEINECNDWNSSINFFRWYGEKPYDTFVSDGTDGDVILCRDNRTGKIFGFGAVCIHLMHVDGEIKRVAYYNAVKLLPEYQHNTMAFPLMIKAGAKLVEGRIDMGFMLTMDGETELKKMYEKKRKSKPSFNRQCMIRMICFRPMTNTRLAEKMSLQTGLTEDMKEFYEKRSPEFNMTPVLDEMTRWEKIWVCWREDGRIKAACALDNVQQRRGYYLRGYRGVLKIVKHLPTWMLGYPNFPKADSVVNALSVSMLMFEEGLSDKEKADFVKAATSLAPGFDMCILSVCDKGPDNGLIKHIRKVNFDCPLYTVDWGEDTDITGKPVFAEGIFF